MNVEKEIERMTTVAEILNLIDMSEMDLMDQLVVIQAYLEFTDKMEPIAKKYGKSVEHVQELKAKKTEKDMADFADLLRKLSGKQG